MILRRLTNALKEQNWTTILIEFVLLASGVFLLASGRIPAAMPRNRSQ